MQKLVYYIVYPFIWILSKAPFFVLYAISDFIYFLLFYIIGYRKKLVLNNLRLSFPEKSNKEIFKIRRKFYAHFVDIFMEMIKTFTISEKELAKHYKFENISVIDDLYNKNKSVILMGSHYGNWEWAAQLALFINHKFVVTYSRVQNKSFETKIKNSRERFGGVMVLKADTLKTISSNYKNNILSLYALLSDQSPQLKKTYYWSNFMGVRVPIHTGAEMLAKKYDLALVNIVVYKIKRGYYTAKFELLTENPKDYKDYELTDLFLDTVEKQIREKPEYYFWSHNRFKHIGKEKISKLK